MWLCFYILTFWILSCLRSLSFTDLGYWLPSLTLHTSLNIWTILNCERKSHDFTGLCSVKYIGLSGHSPKLKATTPLSLIPILLNLKEEEEEGGEKVEATTPPHSSPFCACWRPLNIPETLAQVEGYNSPSLLPILLKLKAAAPDSRESCSARASDSCDLSSMKTAVAETEFLGRENTEIYFLAIGQFQITLFQHFGRISLKQIMCDICENLEGQSTDGCFEIWNCD